MPWATSNGNFHPAEHRKHAGIVQNLGVQLNNIINWRAKLTQYAQ